jgi:hypothetical protein
MVRTVVPLPGMELLPVQQQVSQEEQQAWYHARQIDTELRAPQHQDKLADEQATLDAQLTELHRRKAALWTERATTIDFTKARAQVRAIITAINHEGAPRPTFTKASQNVAAAAVLLDTLPSPSTDGLDTVYRQLRDILSVAAEQQAEVSVLSLGHSKASLQRTATEHPTIGTSSLPARAPSRLRPGRPSGCPEPPACR